MTQFGRALAELNIEILCANSRQAKGRVERVNRTLQDRLVKELRLAGISGIETGNEFLSRFVERFNEEFAIRAARPDNLHRPLNVSQAGSTISCATASNAISARDCPSTMTASRSSWSAMRSQRVWLANTLNSTTTQTSLWKCDGNFRGY
jgi:hypothetical protein